MATPLNAYFAAYDSINLIKGSFVLMDHGHHTIEIVSCRKDEVGGQRGDTHNLRQFDFQEKIAD